MAIATLLCFPYFCLTQFYALSNSGTLTEREPAVLGLPILVPKRMSMGHERNLNHATAFKVSAQMRFILHYIGL